MRGSQEQGDAYNRIRPAHLTLAADYIYLNTVVQESPNARKLAGLSVFTALGVRFLGVAVPQGEVRKEAPTEPTPQRERIARSNSALCWALALF